MNATCYANRDNEVVSENATRSIFTWLRFNGHAPHEKTIRDHEWFALSDSDDSGDSLNKPEIGAEVKGRPSSDIRSWISSLRTHDVALTERVG